MQGEEFASADGIERHFEVQSDWDGLRNVRIVIGAKNRGSKFCERKGKLIAESRFAVIRRRLSGIFFKESIEGCFRIESCIERKREDFEMRFCRIGKIFFYLLNPIAVDQVVEILL